MLKEHKFTCLVYPRNLVCDILLFLNPTSLSYTFVFLLLVEPSSFHLVPPKCFCSCLVYSISFNKLYLYNNNKFVKPLNNQHGGIKARNLLT